MDTLHYFKCICDMHSFSAASEYCCISQSSISKHIQSLEKELGVQLFIRANRTITLTEEGSIVLRYATQILQEREKLNEALYNQKNKNTLDISLLGHTTHYGTWPLLLEYFNNVECKNSIQILPSAAIRSRVLSHAQAFAIMYDSRLDDHLYCKTFLTSDYLAVVVPKQHPLFTKNKVSINDIFSYKAVMLDKSTQIYDFYTDLFSQLKDSPEIVKYELYPETLVRICIMKNLIFPFFYHASFFYNTSDVRVIPFKEKIKANIVLINAKNKPLSAEGQQFVRFFKANRKFLLQADDNIKEKLTDTNYLRDYLGIGGIECQSK